MTTIISRKQALSEGLLWYFTGKPCKRGHVEQRHTRSGSCNGCRQVVSAAFKVANPTYQSNYGKNWRAANPDKYQQYYDKWHENVGAYLYHQVKSRAKKKGMEFDLVPEDVVIPDTCPVFGIPLYVSKDIKTDNSPSVDRIDNDRGYTKDNIQVISWKANRMKNNASLADLKLLVAFLEQLNR